MGCKMSKWQDKSNEEINIAVTGHVHNCKDWELSADRLRFYHHGNDVSQFFEIHVLDYCGNWAFAGPLIQECEIHLIDPTSAGLDGEWSASKFYPEFGKDDIEADDENPLRAAMIVYLEINGVQPNE